MCKAQYYAEKTSLFAGLMRSASLRMNYFPVKPEFIITSVMNSVLSVIDIVPVFHKELLTTFSLVLIVAQNRERRVQVELDVLVTIRS